MRKLFIILLFHFIAIEALAGGTKNTIFAPYLPIRKHLQDATKINLQRSPLYARLTNNRSLALSYELILMEKLALLATIDLDLKARQYLNNNIDLFHEDLVDMKYTPAFSDSFPAGEAPRERIELDIESYVSLWLKDLKNQRTDDIIQSTRDLLDQGELRVNNQNCLTRHFIESITRTLWLMDKHSTDSQKLGLKDSKELSLKFAKIQIMSLKWAYSLDKRAYAIQKAGVPLFCQDVPPIAYK